MRSVSKKYDLKISIFSVYYIDIDPMGKTEEQKLKVTDDLMKALKNKRQIGFGGLFKEIRKELQLEDVENGDLVHVDEDNDDTTLGTEIVAIWNWERKNYFV